MSFPPSFHPRGAPRRVPCGPVLLRPLRTPFVVLAAAALSLLALPTRAQTTTAEGAKATVKAAEKQLTEGDFEGAVRNLQVVLKTKNVDKAVMADTYRLMGLAALYLGADDRAKQAFELLLDTKPDFRVDEDTPPKVAKILEGIRAARRSAEK